MRARARRIPILVTVAVGLALAGAPSVRAETNLPARFPAAGELVRAVAVRAEPSPSSRIVRRLRRFRADHQFQIVLALSARRGADGAWWYRLSLPGHPNGARGWVRADAVEVRPVVNRIVVRLGARRIEVRRIRDGRLLLRSAAAIGAFGSETPRAGLLRPVRLRPHRPVLRDVRAGDVGLRPRHRLAEQRRRHPRHEPARAARAGGLARMRTGPERCRDPPPAARVARHRRSTSFPSP